MKEVKSQTKSTADSVNNHTSKIKTALSGIKGAVAGIAIGTGLYKLGKEAIGVASDIEEVQNVVDTAFGDMSWKVEQFAKNSIQQFGMSELSAKRTASTYMAMARSMDLDPGKASDMAITLAGLTGDVASFYNISQELADTKLKSVFTGETESLKDLGIVMTQTNLQQYALSQGISTNISNMNQAQLTTLRYNYVLSQLSLAQGNFAKTSGSWANQVRILQEQFKQLLGILGNGFIAVLTPVITVLNLIISKVIYFANVISGVFGKIFGKKADTKNNAIKSLGTDATKASKNIGGIGKALDNTTKKAKKTAKEIKGTLSPFDDLNVLSANNSLNDEGKSASKDSSSSLSGGYDVGSIDWGNTFDEPDTSGVDKAVNKVMGYVNKLKSFLNENGPVITSLIAGITAGFVAFEVLKNIGGIASILKPVIDAFILLKTAVWTLFTSVSEGSGIMTGLQAIFSTTVGSALGIATAVAAITAALVYLYQTSESFRSLVNDAIKNTLSILQNLYNKCLKPIFDLLGTLYDTILKPLATLIADVFVTAVSTVASILLSFYNNILTPIANFLVNIFGTAISGICEILKAWSKPLNGLISILTKLWKEGLKPVAEFIVGTFSKAFEIAKGILEPILKTIEELFSGFIDIVVGFLTLNPEKIEEGWNKITGIFEGAYDTICEIFSGIGKWFSDQWKNVEKAFSNVGKFFGDMFGGAWNKIKTVFSVKIVKSFFKGTWDFIKSPFTSAVSWFNSIFGGKNGVWPKIKSIFSAKTIKNFFKGVWSNITGAFGNIVGWFSGKFSNAWKAVKNVFSKGGKIFSGIKDGILNGLKSVINGLIGGINKVVRIPFDGINSVLKKIKNVEIFGYKPFYDYIGTIKVPQLPKLAHGMIANKATVGIFGEAGTEAVIPLRRNTQGLDLIAQKLAERLPTLEEGNGGTFVINLMLPTGERITRWIIKNIKDYEIKTGKPAF